MNTTTSHPLNAELPETFDLNEIIVAPDAPTLGEVIATVRADSRLEAGQYLSEIVVPYGGE